ncbi:phenylacetate-CoA ligase [Cellvibrio sp. BR]|uniref:phenylacetate--CoA ligase family protein n=1 Tax=Cellvibrio sp. BR TaxID=1134474 RepID=UPI0002601365|nr:phenylacetate--CoA ligase family protein [Cellvibrio sp. BR]EIK46705.1 phenylacetate-CoA ligase [Cellvibrio sp. BR]
MNPWMESVYYKSPVFFQNLAVTAMGFKLRNERYRVAGEKKLAELIKTQYFSADQMLKYQSEAFVKIAQHAINNTAFYNNWASRNGIVAGDIKSIEDLNLFPVIEKSYIRENAQEFRAQPISGKSKQFTLHTSGTTGTPLSVYTDQDSRSEHYAFFSRLRSWYGLQPVDRRATMFGRIIMPASQKEPPFWRYDAINKNLLMSSYHLKNENLIHYYNTLIDYKPQEIFSYPSSIVQLADFIIKENLKPIKLKLLMTTAEHLHNHQREKLARAFDAPIVNQYGCTEMAFFASTLPSGDFCLHPEHGIAEVRDSSGALQDGGEGELVVTGLVNFSMPVIRYVIGDNVELGTYNNNGFMQLLDVQGRKDDVIYMRDGTPVGRLDPIFKGGSGIKAAQIFQSEDGNVELRILPDDSYSESLGVALKNELIKRVGCDCVINLVLVNEIEKSKNGKFKSVVSRFVRTI